MSLQQTKGSSSRFENVSTTRLTVSSTATIKNLIGCNIEYDQLCPAPPGLINWVLQDVKPQGSDGGDFIAGDWRTRDLNAIEGDSDNVTLANNQICIQPGTYYIRVRSPAFRVRQHKARFYNVTLDVTEMFGTSEQAREDTTNYSEVEFILKLTNTQKFEVQHHSNVSQVVNGFGVASNFPGAPEVYTIVFISQLQ